MTVTNQDSGDLERHARRQPAAGVEDQALATTRRDPARGRRRRRRGLEGREALGSRLAAPPGPPGGLCEAQRTFKQWCPTRQGETLAGKPDSTQRKAGPRGLDLPVPDYDQALCAACLEIPNIWPTSAQVAPSERQALTESC